MMVSSNWLRFMILGGLLSSITTAGTSAGDSASAPSDFVSGADLSSLLQVEGGGGQFFDFEGQPVELLSFLRDQGMNAVRLRIWHTPADGYHDLVYNLTLAKRIKALNLKLLLDFHYSDNWADPGKQFKPAAWEKLTFPELSEALYQYTKDVLTAFRSQGTPPDMVQIGNEITNGFLWEDAHLTGNPEQLQAFITLLQSGVRGVQDAFQGIPRPEIMLHFDTGGDTQKSQWLLDNLIGRVEFEVIGLSYYSWWQGALIKLKTNLNILAERYRKPIILVEIAYPWTLEWIDEVPNPVGVSTELPQGYPATPDGQAALLNAVLAVVKDVPHGLGRGFYYWEPAAISAPGWGSYWENLTVFDFKGKALPAVRLFGSSGR